MEPLTELVLDVWRAAGRYADIPSFTLDIAPLLQHYLPLAQLVVRRIDPEHLCIDTVSAVSFQRSSRLAERSALEPVYLPDLLQWCEQREVLHRPPGKRIAPALARVIPADGEPDEWLLGPLYGEHRVYGLLLLQNASPQPFTACHVQTLQALLEPCTVALENDWQRRELTTLREAAEADKQSLLRRLGRADVGETIVGAEGRLRPVMERVALVCRSDVPVLILGETGSGKEVIARAIHTRSARATNPFIRINCGAIPADLMDSELFGHERGSFTGAIGTRKGWFERADKGTLFLDEIGELPLAAQVRLLRVLQEGIFERVGGERPLHVDVRIVAATHRDLASMVQQGRFREDLWYRIAVFPIVLPPLREHPEDIAALAEHFAKRAAMRFGFSLQRPSPEDIAFLTTYSWPGNVRELAAVIDRATILGEGQRLEVAKALGIVPNIQTATPAMALPAPAEQTSDSTTFLPLDTVIKQHIEAVLAYTHGRVEGPYGAARLLKLNPHTLRGKMRKLGIDWTKFRDTSPGVYA